MKIEVDLEVYKGLTQLLQSEEDTYNLVVKRLLETLQPMTTESQSSEGAPWLGYGVHLPVGTVLQATYKGQTFTGLVCEEGLEVNDKIYPSLSAAGIAIVGTNINGWNFWKIQDSQSQLWKPVMTLR